MERVFSLGANMRRFVTIPVVILAVVLGAAVPALRAAAQLVDARVADQLVTTPADQLVGVTDQLVGVTDQLVTTDSLLTTDQLASVTINTSLVGTTADLAGTLVDSACYLRAGKAAISGDHAKCAITCAQRGGRLALVTATGDVYMVVGAYTQSNNAGLIQLVNRPIVLTGVVGIRSPDSGAVPTLTSKTDTRHATGPQDGVITVKTVRVGDFREGDLQDAPEVTIEPTGFKLVK
jgi:hypothetical protein